MLQRLRQICHFLTPPSILLQSHPSYPCCSAGNVQLSADKGEGGESPLAMKTIKHQDYFDAEKRDLVYSSVQTGVGRRESPGGQRSRSIPTPPLVLPPAASRQNSLLPSWHTQTIALLSLELRGRKERQKFRNKRHSSNNLKSQLILVDLVRADSTSNKLKREGGSGPACHQESPCS